MLMKPNDSKQFHSSHERESISYNGGITAVTHPSRYKEYIWSLACYNNGTGKQYFLIWWISGCLFLLHVWLVTGLTLLTSFLLSAHSYGRRSGSVLCHALSRGADCAADGFRNQPGGESGPDQIPLDWPTVHLCIRPCQ